MYHCHAGISLLIVTRALAQVVVMINEEVESGKDPKVRDDIDRFGITNRYLGSGFKSLSSPLCSQEIVGLLKARLRMDNPQKQFLSVKLVEQVCKKAMHVLMAWSWVLELWHAAED